MNKLKLLGILLFSGALLWSQAKPQVKIVTNYGSIVVELEPTLAPKTVANFLRYLQEGHFVGTTFHRVVEGFVIQGGGHLEDLSEKPTHDPIPNESERAFKGGLKNTRGTIAMARETAPDTANSQFYINTVDNTRLDFKDASDTGIGYCAFGRVIEGMDTVDRISKVRVEWKKGMQNVPEYPVRIRQVEIVSGTK
ncbi:MAG: peptidyl-prolyl cis-trans isomerase [Acidobacteriota bacterium]|jgi:cyclophilin family peptidyl-prolyl cis-trans isomerase|nr:peptidyl-prolyl cis-trans isomerase [Acidobacteriota bacterium]